MEGLAARFPGLTLNIPNPSVPLAFEEIGGTSTPVEFAVEGPGAAMLVSSNVYMEYSTLRTAVGMGHAAMRDERVLAATFKALEAHGSASSSQAVALARQALQVGGGLPMVLLFGFPVLPLEHLEACRHEKKPLS